MFYSPLLPVNLGDDFSVVYALASLFALLAFILHFRQFALKRLPTAGHSWPGLSYITAIRYYFDGPTVIKEGYNKFPSQTFKIASFTEWIVVVNGNKHINEIKDASETELSFRHAIRDVFQLDHLFGRNTFLNPYHVGIVRGQLTRNLSEFVPSLREEIVEAFNDTIQFDTSNSPEKPQWINVCVGRAMTTVISRVSNRIFVGSPLCRLPGYYRLGAQVPAAVFKDSTTLSMFPNVLRNLLVQWYTGHTATLIAQAYEHLSPIIHDRLAKFEKHGSNYPDKPADAISWLIDEAANRNMPEEMTVENLTRRVILLNFVSISTTSRTFGAALYNLAMEPDKYAEPLRKEVESVIHEYGWTKNAINKLHKVDSFLKESLRQNGPAALTLNRKVLGKDFMFSDGTVIPVGTTLYSPTTCILHDEEYYPDANTFDGFRFSKMRQDNLNMTTNNFVNGGRRHSIPMTSTTPEFLSFGLGVHRCPGRMFAVNELKMVLAHVVLNYDVQMEGGLQVPAAIWTGKSSTLNMQANVLFRRRRSEV